MTSIGYFLSSEEFEPKELVRQAVRAEKAGFERLWISDHFHPWNQQQGQSPFVWSVIGALSQVTELPITTAVTCPIMRIYPAILAQAVATSEVLHEGRFVFGVGTGEALNEHITGERWPTAAVRRDMLEEAVDIIRKLLTGQRVDFHGEYFTVEDARIYTVPQAPPAIYVSGFGPRGAELAGRIGDGYQCAAPDADLVEAFRNGGGVGKPTQAGFKVCHADTREAGLALAHRKWANEQLPGELPQVLPSPAHFEQAVELVPESAVAEAVPAGPDPGPYADQVRKFAEAGFDEIYVQQIGPDQDRFFDFWASQVAPQL